jgi:hypothetical protein
MSALFSRKVGYITRPETVANNVQLRTVPAIFTVPAPTADAVDINDWDAGGVLANVYSNSLNSWLYGVRISFFCHNPPRFCCPFQSRNQVFLSGAATIDSLSTAIYLALDLPIAFPKTLSSLIL